MIRITGEDDNNFDSISRLMNVPVYRVGGLGKKKPRMIRTPADLGDAKTRRKYKRNGPVYITFRKGIYLVSFNTWEEFLQIKDGKEAQKEMVILAEEHNDEEISELLGVSIHIVRRVRLKNLGVKKDKSGNIIGVSEDVLWPPRERGGSVPGNKKREIKQYEPYVRPGSGNVQPVLDNVPIVPEVKTEVEETDCYSIKWNKEYSAGELVDRLKGVCDMLVPFANSTFRVKLVLEEIEEKEVSEEESEKFTEINLEREVIE